MLEGSGAHQREQAKSRTPSRPKTGDENIGIENDSAIHNGIIGDTIFWDKDKKPQKAASNQQKHGISFELVACVFEDPKAVSIFDEDHSGGEDCWITIGMTGTGAILVVNHTFAAAGQDTVVVRLISSRKATKAEQKQYAE